MAPGDARTAVDRVGLYRGMLLIVAVAVPAFALAAWDAAFDPFAARAAFSGLALAALAASYRWAWARARLRLALVLLCHALFVWFMALSALHRMLFEDILGVLPVVIGVAVALRRPLEVVWFIAFEIAVTAVCYRFIDDPVADISIPIALFTAFTAALGWMGVWRNRLEEQLAVANATLEARVAERTDLLMREAAERRAAELRANAASEAKSRFLANMSHELRTPLNAVIGYAELVEAELAGSEQARHCADLERVTRAAGHLLALIDNILDLSQVEAGAAALRREAVAVAPAVDEALMLIAPTLAGRGVPVVRAVAADLELLGDRRAVIRVLVSLLDNAAKFTSNGTITVTAERVGAAVELTVRDTGAGIPAAALGRIFDRFTQADDSATRLFGGAGLGLALCRELVHRMAGSIVVDSAVGVGSTFTVRLPAA
ncbi:MAG: HAMP domain-containing histidine kinase [Myxococcales bacterium]|nr:HAMP domain-containing histidine kinase [Myxococcales bacterium]